MPPKFLARVPRDERTVLVAYLRSCSEADQEHAAALCAGYGIDYPAARAAADRALYDRPIGWWRDAADQTPGNPRSGGLSAAPRRSRKAA